MTEPPFFDRITRDPDSAQWKVYARSDQKVEAIKQFRQLTGASLYEAKNVVMEYIQRLTTGKATPNVRTMALPNGNTITISPEPFGGGFSVTVSKTIASHISEYDLPRYIVKATLEGQDLAVGPARG
jgi:enhancing lycopene biosynthesis protein 2